MQEQNYTFEDTYQDIKNETGENLPVTEPPRSGKAKVMAVFCFLAAAIFLAMGLFLFFGNIRVTSMGMIKSPVINKLMALVTFILLSLLFVLLGVNYVKESKEQKGQELELENRETDDGIEDKLWQRTCPDCKERHDIDYPKCPNCNHDYRKRKQ